MAHPIQKQRSEPAILYDENGRPFDNPNVVQFGGTVGGDLFGFQPGQPTRPIADFFPPLPRDFNPFPLAPHDPGAPGPIRPFEAITPGPNKNIPGLTIGGQTPGANAFPSFSGVPFTETRSGSDSPQIDPAFSDLLELEPDIPFQGALNRANLTPNLFRRFQSQRPQFFGQFQAQLDEQIRSGQAPSLRFADFSNQIDFQEEAFKLSPRDRFGPSSAQRFAPRTTFGT